MKNKLIIITGIILSLSIAPLSHASYTAVPSPPHERQYNLELEPGTTQTESIIIKNLDNEPVTIKLYSADATHSAQGTFALTTKSTTQKHIGKWISFDDPILTLEPKEEVSVPFTITVPEDITPGAYAGGIALESGDTITAGSDEEVAEAISAVSITSRFIVKLFVSVPGERIHSYSWEDFTFKQPTDESHSRFRFDILNSGNTIIYAEPKVEIVGFPPLKDPIIELSTATIEPNSKVQQIEGRWKNRPLLGLYFAKGTITFSEFDIINNTGVNPDTQIKEIMINLTPWYIVVIILVVVVLLLALPFVLYIRKKKLVKRSKVYKTKEGDTIISIAKAYKTDWEKIANANQLKPPYAIQPGQKLLIPPKK